MNAISSPASNILELTVGELSGALKRTIEDRFGFVRVRGEISNYRGPHSSGHAYFCLKDDSARIGRRHLENHIRAPQGEAPGGARGDRDRQGHDLSG